MSKLSDKGAEIISDVFPILIGWLVCMVVLTGAFSIGRWAASFFGLDADRDMAGILSAITIIWIYEHRNFEEKYNRLREILDNHLERARE